MAIPANDYFQIVQSFLLKNRKKDAAQALWPWIVQNEQSDKIWKELEENQYLAILGHGSASKTFTCAQWFLLDWWTDPEHTALIVTSDTVASMGRRVWSDMKILFQKCKVKMPGELIDSKGLIIYDPNDHKNAIAAIAAESDNAQSKIQGIHTKRVRVLIDEADNAKSRSIWSALANLGTSGELKVAALANPEDRFSDFGQHIEPVDGWSSIHPEADFKWKSKVGWTVLRLDGLQSPNIIANEDKYPFMLTNKHVNDIIEKHGENSLEWWKYIRAWYPPEDQTNTVFSFELIEKAKKNKIVWYSSIQAISACDPAFEGGDNCVQAFGHFGRLAENPLKTALLVYKFVKIKRKDMHKELHLDFADQVIQNCKDEGVAPHLFCMDSTGNASFMASYVKTVWSSDILAVCFAGNASEDRIFQEDELTAKQRFDRFVTELWFGGRDWMKAGLIQLEACPNELSVDLTSRKYFLKGKGISSIEEKKVAKSRGVGSPDYGDAFNLLVHCLRYRGNVTKPSVTGEAKKVDHLQRFQKKSFSYKASYGVKEPENGY